MSEQNEPVPDELETLHDAGLLLDSDPQAAGPWAMARRDDLLALHRVALLAREAVQLCEGLGVHLGPLRAALSDTPYRVRG